MSTFITKKQTKKRKHGRALMVAGDIDTARAVTHTKIAVTQSDGSVVIKQKLESLDTPSQSIGKPIDREALPIQDEYNLEQMDNMSPPPPTGETKTYRVSKSIEDICKL
jgi:hypothetical protein